MILHSEFQYNYDKLVLQYCVTEVVPTSSLGQEKLFFGHLLFNITNVFCAKKWVGHACICPRMVSN